MELKVWTDDGMLSLVSGVDIKTTCRDVMVAVAQATGGVGRYCMSICFRDICKRLNPADKPLLILDGLGEPWCKDARFFVSFSTKATHNKLKSQLEIMEVISNSQEVINKFSAFDKDILTARASSESQDPKSFENEKNTIPQFTQSQSLRNGARGLSRELQTSGSYQDESSRKSFLDNHSSPIAKEKFFEQADKLYLESLDECDRASAKHQLHNEDENLRLFISNERDNNLKLQDRMILLKNESKKEDDTANIEMQKIEALLRSLAELQANNDKINIELEELELVSWKDKLQIEKSKEEKLQEDTKEAESKIEILSNHVLALDDDVSKIKQRIIAEEDLKHSLKVEIDGLKQDLGDESENVKKSQEALEKLDANIISLQEMLKQNEEEIEDLKKSTLIKVEDAYNGHI